MQSEIDKLSIYGEAKREAFKYLAQVRERCLELAIYNLNATEENATEIASKLEKYILNGEANTAITS